MVPAGRLGSVGFGARKCPPVPATARMSERYSATTMAAFSSQVNAFGGGCGARGGSRGTTAARVIAASHATGSDASTWATASEPAETSTSAGSVLAITGAPNVRASSNGKPKPSSRVGKSTTVACS